MKLYYLNWDRCVTHGQLGTVKFYWFIRSQVSCPCGFKLPDLGSLQITLELGVRLEFIELQPQVSFFYWFVKGHFFLDCMLLFIFISSWTGLASKITPGSSWTPQVMVATSLSGSGGWIYNNFDSLFVSYWDMVCSSTQTTSNHSLWTCWCSYSRARASASSNLNFHLGITITSAPYSSCILFVIFHRIHAFRTLKLTTMMHPSQISTTWVL